MNDAGYTLAEALAALIIVGLAVGGVTQGVAAISRLQAGTATRLAAQDIGRRANDELARLLVRQGPFSSDADSALAGDRNHFTFPCGAEACGASLEADEAGARLAVAGVGGQQRRVRLGLGQELRFVYLGTTSSGEAWPPAGLARQKLRAISLIGWSAQRGDVPLALTRIWIDQPADCRFDLINRDCRKGAAG